MAHECPVCYLRCHCNGDIDDLMLNDWDDVNKCTHCDELYDDNSEGEDEE